MPQIFVTTEAGPTLTLEVDLSSDTVANIKTKVWDKEGIPVEEQELSFEGTLLEDDSQTLASCGIVAESALLLTRREITIQVSVQQPSGEVLVFSARPTDSVLDVKYEVEQRGGFAVPRQRLLLNDTVLEDYQFLSQLVTEDHPRELTLLSGPRFNIILDLYTGGSIPLEVNWNEPVDTLQTVVHSRGGIPYHFQEMIYDGRVLELGQRISDYRVPDDARIRVVQRHYEATVFIKTLTGRTIILRVAPTDTVAMVKGKIEAQEGIPVARQRLIFVGEQLNDHHRLLDYRIEHESAVHLVVRMGDGFQVFVQVPSGRTMVFEVQPTDTISELKSRIRERGGIPGDVQHLFLDGQELQNESTFREANVQPSAILHLELDEGRDTQIFIAYSNSTTTLWVNPDMTVGALKAVIAEREHIAVDVQELYFARRLLENDRTLRSYVIEDNHVLHLEIATPPMLEFTAKLQSGATIRLEVAADQTVEEVKREIQRREGIPVEEQELFFAGNELENYQKLRDCEITNGCDLDLITTTPSNPNTPMGITLFVKTLTGKTIALTVNPMDSVEDLKKQIEEKEGIQIATQCLVAAGRQLSNDTPISICGLQNQSVLHLILRVPSHGPIHVSVTDQNGTNLQLEVNVDDTIEHLKALIRDEADVPNEQLTVLFNGGILLDDRTLGSYDIKDGATLYLEHNETDV